MGRIREALIKSTGQIGEQIFRLLKNQNLEILGVFQDFGAKTGGKYAVKMCLGIYSEVP